MTSFRGHYLCIHSPSVRTIRDSTPRARRRFRAFHSFCPVGVRIRRGSHGFAINLASFLSSSARNFWGSTQRGTKFAQTNPPKMKMKQRNPVMASNGVASCMFRSRVEYGDFVTLTRCVSTGVVHREANKMIIKRMKLAHATIRNFFIPLLLNGLQGKVSFRPNSSSFARVDGKERPRENLSIRMW